MSTGDTVGVSPCLRVAGWPAEGERVAAAARESADCRVAAVGPTGATGLEPLAMATREGRTAFHADVEPTEAADLGTALDDGDLPTDGALAVVDHDPDTARLPVPEDTALGVGRRQVLSRCGWVAPTSVADAERDGLVAGGVSDGTVHERVGGIRGRGRGDAATDGPVGETWAETRAADGNPVVVVNGTDTDPAVAGDETLLASVPLEVLDGALAVAAAVDAAEVVVAAPAEPAGVGERVRAARDALVAEHEVAADVEVVAGPDLYRAAEPTMALEALEGNDRIEARRRPPGPATYGLFGRPTVVHTPRTVAAVREALRRPDAVDPEATDPGTRLVTVSGDVTAPATVELPTGAPLARALDAVDHDGWRFACVGGQFGGLTRDLDVPASAPAMAGADLGTGGAVELFDERACAVATAGHRARFAREENCGRCVPCREGATQVTDLLRAVYDGEFDEAGIRELLRTMRETSLCQFGREAARPVTTALDEFGAEFRAHADGDCPTGACEEVEA